MELAGAKIITEVRHVIVEIAQGRAIEEPKAKETEEAADFVAKSWPLLLSSAATRSFMA
jgi:hypothetical protein